MWAELTKRKHLAALRCVEQAVAKHAGVAASQFTRRGCQGNMRQVLLSLAGTVKLSFLRERQ